VPVLFFRSKLKGRVVDDQLIRESQLLKCLIMFSVGSLLFDSFCHILPEAYELVRPEDRHLILYRTIYGVILFFVIERIGSAAESYEEGLDSDVSKAKKSKSSSTLTELERKNKMAANLNLLANTMDNFSHGLTVGSAFLISSKSGFLSSVGVLLHEIPHEFGDFAILLKSGKTIFQCSVCQLSTSVTSFLGGWTALYIGQSFQRQALAWLLPLSAGGFLFIAMSTMKNFNDNYATISSIPYGKKLSFLTESASLLTGIMVMDVAMRWC